MQISTTQLSTYSSSKHTAANPTTHPDGHSKFPGSKWTGRMYRTITKADSRRRLIAELSLIPGAVNMGLVVDTGTGFSSNISPCPCQYHYENAPCRYIKLLPTLYYLSSWITSLNKTSLSPLPPLDSCSETYQ